MVRAPYKPVSPDQRVRDLRKEFRGFEKEEPGPDRAARLAVFARAAHDDRQLNMAMHAAQLCLQDDDAGGAQRLVDAYGAVDGDPEEQLRSFSDLKDLARYVDRPDIVAIADDLLLEHALAWVADTDDQEQRHRLRTLTSLAGRAFADDIRDRLERPR